MLRDVEVNDPPAVMEQDDEDEQDATRDSRYGEEIHRAQRRDVIREERSPCLRRRATRPPHEPGDGSLRHRNAQLAQLAVDARSAPERIRGGHLHDECTNGCIRTRAARTTSRGAPRPLAAEPMAMPTHDGVRVHNDQGCAPILPRVGEQHPKQSISVAELRTPHGALEHGQC